MLLSLKSLAFYSHDGGNKEDQLPMPFLSKLLMGLLRSPEGSLGCLTLYMRKRKSIPDFSSLTFCICFSSLDLSILCPLWPMACSISASQVQPAHPRIAFLNVPSFIFSSWATYDFQWQFSEADQDFIIYGGPLFLKQSREHRCHLQSIKWWLRWLSSGSNLNYMQSYLFKVKAMSLINKSSRDVSFYIHPSLSSLFFKFSVKL